MSASEPALPRSPVNFLLSMYYREIFLASLLFALSFLCHASENDENKPTNNDLTPSRQLFLELTVVDFPFIHKAAKMRANLSTGQFNGSAPRLSDYLEGYESPSMHQVLTFTKSLHSLNYYAHNKLWDKWLQPNNRKKRIFNRIGANLTAGLTDLVFTYYGIVFSPQWLHEEFHRAGMTIRGVPSYDETYNRLVGGVATGSVSRVKDEHLISWKKEAPQEMIRSFAAGIESELLLLRSLQKDNFKGADYPNILMNILLTKHTIDYVKQFSNPNFDASIDSMNYHGGNVRDRDFVGWDFSAWVYDLHRPDAPYIDRGLHPSGIGVDRAVKKSKLSQEEIDYLTQMGKLQYLNFLSPFMIGISQIKINYNTQFNFATRHYLTSFGYDLTLDIFLSHKNRPFLFGLHGYRNKNKFYPGIEFESAPFLLTQKKSALQLQPRAMVWLQPPNQRFDDIESKAGALLQFRLTKPISKNLNVYIDTEAKTGGWVAGNPYLGANLSFRSGITAHFSN